MKILLTLVIALTTTGCATIAKIKGDDSVQVQGRTMAYSRSGSGTPTVVFESGLGDNKEKWTRVAGEVAKSATVFTYDRPGYGASMNANGRRSAVEIVSDLRALLVTSGVKPPYVLVGHSLGGLYMQYFARQFPDEVAGLVLVESSHWDQDALMTKGTPGSMASVKALSNLMEPHVRAELQGSIATEKQVRDAPALNDIPVVVLTGTRRNILERGTFATVWYALQKEEATAYHAEQIIADRSGHYVHEDQPELVVGAINKVIGLRRTTYGQP